MKVFGFVGPSGTGKSHRAVWVAREKEIDYIIDDGLLIRGTQIIAGTSAKREKTKIGSIKCALFKNTEHADEVKKAIQDNNPESILILGTSDGMVETIAKTLGFPGVSEKIYIHEVATEFEIRQALSTRKSRGNM